MEINQVGPFLRAMRDPEGKGGQNMDDINKIENRAAEIQEFCARKFSGRDLLTIMDEEGIGVGATMHIVEMIDKRIAQDSIAYRKWDFPPGQKDEIVQNVDNSFNPKETT